MTVEERTPVTYTGANGENVHCPLVVGSLGRRQVRFVLDTGSDVHLLDERLADALGLDKEPGEEGVDHSGAAIPSWSVGNVELVLGNTTIDLRGVVAIPTPDPFRDLGIGGILSPQNLHPTAWVVLDMRADELVVVSAGADEVAALVGDGAPGCDPIVLERDPDHAALVVSAAIEPFEPLPTLLNTGGARTEFASDAVPGLEPGEGERIGAGVGGADVTGGSVGARVLLVGGRRIEVPSLVVRQSMNGPRAMIGMDVLRGTVLACTADAAQPVQWEVEGGAKR